jgi:hypothetical protein
MLRHPLGYSFRNLPGTRLTTLLLRVAEAAETAQMALLMAEEAEQVDF